ncbi:hypothetical protein QWA68_009112 [Fusarium oxysporum]|nr:hypothetical protein QWA68_009112 [Fusarium oxysporum]
MMSEVHQEPPVAVCNRSVSGSEPSLRPYIDLYSGTDFVMHYKSSPTQDDDVQALQADHLLRTWIPFRELPSRRKVVWIWTCCVCGQGGMKISVDPCFRCGFDRCPNCETRRANTRPR